MPNPIKLGRKERMTFSKINEVAEKGAFSIACAFASILILITYGSVLLMNLVIKFFGPSRKIKEGE